MKTLLALVAGVTIVGIVVLATVGALRVRNAGDEVHITIDKKEVKATTEQAVGQASGGTRRGIHQQRFPEIISITGALEMILPIRSTPSFAHDRKPQRERN